MREPVRVGRAASLIDTAPTILDLLGLPTPAAYHGHSLLEDRPRLALFFTDYALARLGLRDDRWKFLHELDSGRSKLFDLQADPGERHDLAPHFPARVTAYRHHLLRWAAAQRALVLRSR
jgi:arylsulfatase A-like enzyme